VGDMLGERCVAVALLDADEIEMIASESKTNL
jgi:hypothetical protein